MNNIPLCPKCGTKMIWGEETHKRNCSKKERPSVAQSVEHNYS